MLALQITWTFSGSHAPAQAHVRVSALHCLVMCSSSAAPEVSSVRTGVKKIYLLPTPLLFSSTLLHKRRWCDYANIGFLTLYIIFYTTDGCEIWIMQRIADTAVKVNVFTAAATEEAFSRWIRKMPIVFTKITNWSQSMSPWKIWAL